MKYYVIKLNEYGKELEQYEKDYVNQVSCKNPHDLVRIHEVFDILEIAKMLLHKLEENYE